MGWRGSWVGRWRRSGARREASERGRGASGLGLGLAGQRRCAASESAVQRVLRLRRGGEARSLEVLLASFEVASWRRCAGGRLASRRGGSVLRRLSSRPIGSRRS